MRFTGVLVALLLIFIAAAPALAEEYGSISGIVTSANNAAVPDAVVTLWAILDGTPVFAAVPNNPQYTSNFSSTLPGAYTFTHVPVGRYNVTAAWGDYWYYTEVNLIGGTATANIVIPAYINVTALATPLPTPKTYYTYVPVEVSSPLPQATTRSPGFGALIALIAILIVAFSRKRP
ncbi:carboxypeptidase-like regulatory domain-containing protein [Methanocella conradii]|uniref:carboxypeptidase-like regulatory domain-containing protein n=1 Tax=Methanocella conradii TaxID=1175444 RepID=UPI00157E0375|nr:carboxypeptidase-like regulatory domain-containing protein [Methanocella conradii]